MDSLGEIARLVAQCADCGLHQSRTKGVPGEGVADAELMLIGEGPGVQEDRQGRPFVGPAGQFLEELLSMIGLERRQVFIANMVKCRPPQNRDPLPAEISACSKYLDRQIELINPALIVTLGRFSLTYFFPGESMTRARGRLRQKNARLIYPVMHPAAALYRQEMRGAIIEDFQRIPAILAEARQGLADPTPAAAEEASPPGQLNLF